MRDVLFDDTFDAPTHIPYPLPKTYWIFTNLVNGLNKRWSGVSIRMATHLIKSDHIFSFITPLGQQEKNIKRITHRDNIYKQQDRQTQAQHTQSETANDDNHNQITPMKCPICPV